jgi:long-chain acyl-CoA synthetase
MAWFERPKLLLPDLIAQNGRWMASRQAVVDGDAALTWSQFAIATAQLANALLTLGIRPRDRVAVLMDTRLESVITLFGILRSGAVAVPLNVSVTDAAVAAMCADAKCVAVFASGNHCLRIDALRSAGLLSDARVFVGCEAPSGWHDLENLLADQTSDIPGIEIEPGDECNLIYSSGTTSIPKGIVHTHESRVFWAYDIALALRYRNGCRTLMTLGLFSNISWASMLATMLVGGTIVLLRAFSPERALAAIQSNRITHSAFVPVQLERLLACPERHSYRTESIKTIMCCGSPLPAVTKRGFAREFDCELIELYGLTEGLITILEPEDLERKVLSVGKPVFGSDIRIIGDDDREMAIGATGEIVGRGRLVMAGYHASDEVNRDTTWIDSAGAQWLRTGDLGRIDEEGFLYIVDRKKDMIISGGQNIYPVDLENVVRGHPAVAEVAVIGVASERWGETPVAVIVPRLGEHPLVENVLQWTNGQVGRQQRLSGVVVRESLPRNANGKVLKRELRRELSLSGAPRETAHDPIEKI